MMALKYEPQAVEELLVLHQGTCLESPCGDACVLAAEVRELQEELNDGNAAYRQVMKEVCTRGPDDVMHCTCVPHLRQGVKELTEKLKARASEK